ncbi:hypothetical protein [Serratia rhizosphaerae]|uniref:Uncharacterized protein n=1 Tax=Serratia rhizosphaerae TaxID=2597702 RepID=A0ABX6GH18_9GAMM|nr:hypothetical protein [Serratia rhizosphaerae]QHA85529.1 hypothetical protein FO014_00240 [Serratia rhizosphaerae]
MTTIIRNLDMEIKNPTLPPLYEPFASVPGLIAGWRFGEGFTDLSGNGHTLKEVGTPSVGEYFVAGDKDNGFITDVPDGMQRTLIAVYRQAADVNTFGYPVGNIVQNASANGEGIAITDVSVTSLRRRSAYIGGKSYNEKLYGTAAGPAEATATRNNFAFSAVTIDGAGNTAGFFIPSANADIIPATLASGVNLAERSITESGAESFYRIIAWRNSNLPPVPPSSPNTGLAVAEVLIYDRPLSLTDLNTQYGRSKRYFESNYKVKI